jgi:hypothetical protein
LARDEEDFDFFLNWREVFDRWKMEGFLWRSRVFGFDDRERVEAVLPMALCLKEGRKEGRRE